MSDINMQEIYDAYDSRDTFIIHLVSSHGYTLNKATRAWQAFARNAGISTHTASCKDEAQEWLEDRYHAGNWTAERVRDAVVELGAVFDVAESTARDYTKAFSKFLKVTHPMLDPRAAMFDFLIKNRGMAAADLKIAFKEFGKDLGRSSSNVNEYWKGYELHLALNAAIAADSVDEVKEAWDKLNDLKRQHAAGIKVAKGSVHPDRIIYLDDDELTAAYNAFFQELNM